MKDGGGPGAGPDPPPFCFRGRWRLPEHQYQYQYQPGTSQVLLISNKLPTGPADQGQDTMLLSRDSTWRSYDDAGFRRWWWCRT